MPKRRTPPRRQPPPRGPGAEQPEEAAEGGEGGLHIDLGLGELFKGIGGLVELAGKLTEEGSELSEIRRTGEIEGLGPGAKGIFGLNIRTLAGGEAKVERFGNIRPTPKGPVVEEVREPIVDVFEEEDYVHIVAELPGVEEGDIEYDIDDDVLTLSSDDKSKKYTKEVELPCAVVAEGAESTYKNGVFELKLKRAEEPEEAEDEEEDEDEKEGA